MTKKLEIDYGPLRGRIKQILGSEAAYGDAIGLSAAAVSKRLNNRVCFTTAEVIASAKVLGITYAEIPRYFLTRKLSSS